MAGCCFGGGRLSRWWFVCALIAFVVAVAGGDGFVGVCGRCFVGCFTINNRNGNGFAGSCGGYLFLFVFLVAVVAVVFGWLLWYCEGFVGGGLCSGRVGGDYL